MASDTKNVKLGVCSVTFDGHDLGYTSGGVDVAVATTTKEVTVDQFGPSPINEYILGRTCTAKVPLAETTLQNLARIMPGAVVNGVGGAAAAAAITLSTAVPVDGDKVRLGAVDFTFKTSPVSVNDVAIGGTFAASATNLKNAINNSIDPAISSITPTVLAGVVTLTADDTGVAGNAATFGAITSTFATPANCVVTQMTGGVDATISSVTVPNGAGLSLLTLARQLVLHPKSLPVDDRSEDFTIPLAMTPGAATFAYKTDTARVFNVDFKAYPDPATKKLFVYGDARSA